MNETVIQNRLWLDLMSGSQIVIPNFTPLRWWECDMWNVTKAGYAVEHEIKISRSDFLADAKKEKRMRFGDEPINKHEQLHFKHEHAPRQFWYVVPEGLIEERELPAFAGLKYVYECEPRRREKYLSIGIIKKAPFLHKTKAKEEDITAAKKAFYYRFWNLRQKLNKI